MATVSNLAGMPEQVGGRSPQLYSIDPLSDVRWDALVAKHPKASVFHQRGWLTSLASTYGYKPIVLTSAAAGEPLSAMCGGCHGSRGVSVDASTPSLAGQDIALASCKRSDLLPAV